MEKIQLFVDNMFLSLPDTPEVRQAKAHILEGMADRYEALLAQGKNENEALGLVIGEFGSVEELRQELGLGSLPQGDGPLPSPAPVPFPQEEYDRFRRLFPLAMAGGVVLCILAVVASIVLSQLSWARAWNLHHIGMFSLIAVAVGIFVYFGVREGGYQARLRASQGLPPEDGEERGPFHGVIMMVTTAVYLYLGFFRGLWHPGWIVFLVGAALARLADRWEERR